MNMSVLAKTSCYTSLALILVCLHNISFSEAFKGSFSVEMIHRDSPRSPFYRPTETEFQRVANAVHRSINRANHFNKLSVPSKTIEAPVTVGQGEYLMSYSVGTPPFHVFAIVDTGSDIVWVQCKPCKNCYNQTTPMFDPSKSNTYKNLPCSSTECTSAEDTSCSIDDKKICAYSAGYGDGSYSEGDLSVETLTLSSTNGSLVQLPSIVIGCGHNNSVSSKGQSSGIVGLGGGSTSLISQLSSSIGGKFSYCLTPMFLKSNTSSKLNFGDNAVVSGVGTVTTPLVPQEEETSYVVTLNGFSVGNKRIKFPSPTPWSPGKGNVLLDSGTTLTFVPYQVYSDLQSAVANAIKLSPVEDPYHQLSPCYKTTSGKLDKPIITAHFSGADIQLNAINTFAPVGDEIMCLAFTSIPSPLLSIFGNLAQQNFLIGYDLQKKTLSFKPTDCTKH